MEEMLLNTLMTNIEPAIKGAVNAYMWKAVIFILLAMLLWWIKDFINHFLMRQQLIQKQIISENMNIIIDGKVGYVDRIGLTHVTIKCKDEIIKIPVKHFADNPIHLPTSGRFEEEKVPESEDKEKQDGTDKPAT